MNWHALPIRSSCCHRHGLPEMPTRIKKGEKAKGREREKRQKTKTERFVHQESFLRIKSKLFDSKAFIVPKSRKRFRALNWSPQNTLHYR